MTEIEEIIGIVGEKHKQNFTEESTMPGIAEISNGIEAVSNGNERMSVDEQDEREIVDAIDEKDAEISREIILEKINGKNSAKVVYALLTNHIIFSEPESGSANCLQIENNQPDSTAQNPETSCSSKSPSKLEIEETDELNDSKVNHDKISTDCDEDSKSNLNESQNMVNGNLCEFFNLFKNHHKIYKKSYQFQLIKMIQMELLSNSTNLHQT